MMRDQAFVTHVYNLLESAEGCPSKHTAVVHRLVYGKAYDEPSGYKYRRLLKALNELEEKQLIWAQRGRDGTMWMAKRRDALWQGIFNANQL